LAFGAPELALRGLRASTAGAIGHPGCQRPTVSVESAEIGSEAAEHDASNLAILGWCAARPRGGAHSRRGAYGRCRQLSRRVCGLGSSLAIAYALRDGPATAASEVGVAAPCEAYGCIGAHKWAAGAFASRLECF